MKTFRTITLLLALVTFFAVQGYSQTTAKAEQKKATQDQTKITAAPGKFVDNNKNGVCDKHESKMKSGSCDKSMCKGNGKECGKNCQSGKGNCKGNCSGKECGKQQKSGCCAQPVKATEPANGGEKK